MKERLIKNFSDIDELVVEIKKRILEWPNPVEYVNNMYGCHPGGNHRQYFEKIFRAQKRDDEKQN